MNKLLLLLSFAFSIPAWAQTSSPMPVSVSFTSSDLPIIVITTDQPIVDDPKIEARMGIIDNGPGQRNALTDPFNNYNGNIGIELRGSSSQMFPKKSYGFETHNASGADVDVSLLGMPAGSDWILSASFPDKSLMRNVLMYNIARESGNYASRTRYCEVVLNGAYMGIYVFMEKLKRGADRINVSKLKSSDKTGDAVTGGYILKLDKTTGTTNASWTSKYTNPTPNNFKSQFLVEYPKLEDINSQQLNYIQAYVDSFETALNNKKYNNLSDGYRHFINTKSFIDYFLLTELSRNPDSYFYSTYFYKDRTSKGGKLTMGPMWDYDIAWANADYCQSDSVAGWVYNNLRCGAPKIPFWWKSLLEDPAFTSELRARWVELRSTALKEQHLTEQINATATLLAESRVRNFTAWPILGTYVWPNAAVLATYPEEVAYLKRWIHNRLEWMDGALTQETSAVMSNKLPTDLTTATAFPIPFTNSLTVTYSLKSASTVSVVLVDALGRQVAKQSLPQQPIGNHSVSIEGCEKLVPGAYYVQLISNTGCRTVRVLRTES
jgi:hypothetical protein